MHAWILRPIAIVFSLVIAAGTACAPSAPPMPTVAPVLTTAAAPMPGIKPAPAGRLEIFSWWTTGGEAAGLSALFALYQKQNPGVDIVNATVAGGGGSNAKAVLMGRMLSNDPPDSFQVHMGHELTDTWVVANKMNRSTPSTRKWGSTPLSRRTSSTSFRITGIRTRCQSTSTARMSSGTTRRSSQITIWSRQSRSTTSSGLPRY